MDSSQRGKRAFGRLGLAVALAGIPFSGALVSPALAQSTETTTFQVTATIANTCVISATALAFGPYTGTQLDATSTITVTCTATTPWQVGLDAGTAAGATTTTRKMTNGASTLNYSLFRNSTRTLNWGNTLGTDTLTGVATGLQQLNTVYGRIPAAQAPAPGAYLDTITATVTF
jgi:spore coat protein U-like protein